MIHVVSIGKFEILRAEINGSKRAAGDSFSAHLVINDSTVITRGHVRIHYDCDLNRQMLVGHLQYMRFMLIQHFVQSISQPLQD